MAASIRFFAELPINLFVKGKTQLVNQT